MSPDITQKPENCICGDKSISDLDYGGDNLSHPYTHVFGEIFVGKGGGGIFQTPGKFFQKCIECVRNIYKNKIKVTKRLIGGAKLVNSRSTALLHFSLY